MAKLKNKRFFLFSTAALALLFSAFFPKTATPVNPEELKAQTLWDILEKLGEQRLHQINKNIEGASLERGREIVHLGQTTDAQGKKTEKQSPYFVCTSCHNVAKDQASLLDLDPQNKLEYAAKQNLPLLPANSFFATVNRHTFYNDDYQKKYGHVKTIAKAKKDLRTAIQVCATECSQGRALEDWELESVLMYFWSLELKVSDLQLQTEELEQVAQALEAGKKEKKEAVELLQSKYLLAYPAHFIDPPEYKELTEEQLADKTRYDNGKLLYDMSCKHCHGQQRYSSLLFDYEQATFAKLYENITEQAPHSITNAIRLGIPANTEKKTSYMPQYSKEHLSNEQLLDLRIYIENMARYGAVLGSEQAPLQPCDEHSISYADVKALLQEKCENCHNSLLAPDFSSYSTMKPSLTEGSFDIRVFIRKDMPIGQQLSPEELRLLECWKKGGFLEN